MSASREMNDASQPESLQDDELLRCVFYFDIGATALGEMHREKMNFRRNKSKFWRRHYNESLPDVDESKFEIRPKQINCWSMRRFEALKAAGMSFTEEDCEVTVYTSELVSLDKEINDFGIKRLFNENERKATQHNLQLTEEKTQTKTPSKLQNGGSVTIAETQSTLTEVSPSSQNRSEHFEKRISQKRSFRDAFDTSKQSENDDNLSSEDAVYDDECVFGIGQKQLSPMTKIPRKELQNGSSVTITETQSTSTEVSPNSQINIEDFEKSISKKRGFRDAFDTSVLSGNDDMGKRIHLESPPFSAKPKTPIEELSMDAMYLNESCGSLHIETIKNDEELRNKMDEMFAALDLNHEKVLQDQTYTPESIETNGTTEMDYNEQNGRENNQRRSTLNPETSSELSSSSDDENVMLGYEADDEARRRQRD